MKNCNAKYGGANEVLFDLQSYVNEHISRSFDYLLMVSCHTIAYPVDIDFDNQNSRDGGVGYYTVILSLIPSRVSFLNEVIFFFFELLFSPKINFRKFGSLFLPGIN